MLKERLHSFDELEYASQEFAFRNYVWLEGWIGDIEPSILTRLKGFIDDPKANRFVTEGGEVFALGSIDEELFWCFDENELTLPLYDLGDPIMDVYSGRPVFEITRGCEDLVDIVELNERPDGSETEASHGEAYSIWFDLYVGILEDELRKLRPDFLSEVGANRVFTHDGYYDYMGDWASLYGSEAAV